MKKYILKKTAICLALVVFFQAILPQAALALTSGPSTPEVQSFEPVGTSEMVDVFSGDFNYNIPLLEVGGYPINIAYHAGIGMEDEASWVGLGWNLNPGVINRNMRGIPDDFAGEEIEKNIHIKDNHSASLALTPSIELFGVEKDPEGIVKQNSQMEENKSLKLKLTAGLKYDNYRGFDVVAKAGLGLDIVQMGSSSLNVNLGVDLQEGFTISPNLSFSNYIKEQDWDGYGINIGTQYNSRQGLKSLSFTTTRHGKFIKSIDEPKNEHSELIEVAGSSGVSFAFNTPSYITHAEHNVRNTSFSMDLKIGGSIPFTNVAGAAIGTYNKMSVEGKRKMEAYGYLNSGRANNSSDLMDFNRENDGPYYKGSSQLPLTNMTYDSYSVLGQGVGGVFRPFRNQVGYVSDPVARGSDGVGADLGIEIGAPASVLTFKLGGSVAINTMSSYSGIWKDKNEALSSYGFDKYPDDDLSQLLFERSYFKQIGELSVDSRYDDLQLDNPLRPDVDKLEVSDKLISREGNVIDTDDVKAVRSERAKRNQPMTAMNVAEANKAAVLRRVESYEPGINVENGSLVKDTEGIYDRAQALGIKSSQLYELTTIKSDGMRYVYGLPAYNISQTEVTFNSSGNPMNQALDGPGTVRFTKPSPFNPSAPNDITKNDNGIDGFSSVERLPAYSYAYHLTAVLSDDYIDFSGDGPSDDDFGTWVKFNYTKITKNNDNYFWKFPYVKDGVASLSEGFKSYEYDDKGTYIEGEKEIWQLHSIESKNHIAIFNTCDRLDAIGVHSDGRSAQDANINKFSFTRQQKLNSIEYYSKHDLLNNSVDAVPLKTVHFDYSYELCEGVPNKFEGGSGECSDEEGNGKLTLKSLYFTYGKSKKGERSKYKFHYPTDSIGNPDYDRKAQDRWGNYKPEGSDTETPDYEPTNIANSPVLSNSDYPYAEQDREKADQNARAWNMNKIELPSGGIINIEYEADDYAYIQDKRAGQMFQIEGLSFDAPMASDLGVDDLVSVKAQTPEESLFTHNHYRYLSIDVDDDLVNSSQDFQDLYLKGIDKLYFRALVKLKDEKAEFIPGYADIIGSGIFTANGNTFGYIKLRGVGIDDDRDAGELNPITKAALNFTRLKMPHLVWSEKDPEKNDVEQFLLSLTSLLFKEPGRILNGLNKSMLTEGYASSLVLDKSFVRLNNPNYAKIGGGCRVKKITMSDNWALMAGGEDSSYGQEYFYKKAERTADGTTKMISSGVATYEPVLGNDENPFKTPMGKGVHEGKFLAPDNNYYFEGPIGESFFPAASVGYSEVVVAATRPHEDINRTATGFTKTSFYTARDFPIKTMQNLGKPYDGNPSLISKILNYREKHEASGSAGYSIILNDMHGKPKGTWTFNGALQMTNGSLDYSLADMQREDFISGQTYHYKTNESGDELENEVDVLDPNGKVSKQILGVESELTLDYREHSTKVHRYSAQGNVDTWIIPFVIPPTIVAGMGWPNFKESSTRFRSAVGTKLVTKHGLLDKISVHQNGSVISTKNELYDAVTGDVLVISVNNEYKDDNALDSKDNNLYNLSYPAHWAYTGMQPAAKNIGADFFIENKNSYDTNLPPKLRIYAKRNGSLVDQSLNLENEIIHPGDEVIGFELGFIKIDFKIFSLNFPIFKSVDRLWVSCVEEENDSTYFRLIDRYGELYYPPALPEPGEPASNWGAFQYPKLKIIKSGHKNQQSLPIASMTSLKDPIPQLFEVDGMGPLMNDSQTLSEKAEALRVLDVTAQEYQEDWETYCRDIGNYKKSYLCDYEFRALHPVTKVPNQAEIKVLDNYSVIEFWGDVEGEAFGDCPDLIDTNSLLSTLSYDNEISTVIEDSFYYDTIKVQIVDPVNPSIYTDVSIPASDIIYYTSQQSTFNSDIKNRIRNHLQSLGVNIPFTSVQSSMTGNVHTIAFDILHNPSQKWAGFNKGEGEVSYYNPSLDQIEVNSNVKIVYQGSDGFSSNLCDTYITTNNGNMIDPELADNEHIRINWLSYGDNQTTIDAQELLFLPSNIVCGEIEECADLIGADRHNPYVQGTKGNFRPSRAWVHNNVPRVQASVDQNSTDQTDIANQGYYEYFDPFWNKPLNDGNLWTTDASHYTKATEVTRYNPYGEALESKDALGNYSSAILGYDNKLAIAVGQNTKYNEFGFDGFEEYNFFQNEYECSQELHFQAAINADDVTSSESHSGHYSLGVSGTTAVAFDLGCIDPNPSSNLECGEYKLDRCEDCIPFFNPEFEVNENNTYVLDVWVRDIANNGISISQYSGGNLISGPTIHSPQNNKIEGWQRVYETFDLLSNTDQVQISFSSSGTQGYIDDIRIYPFDAVMKSFVYDPGSLKLMAELDENNHATFYEYDEEWNLIRVKKETERGIYTLQENRSNIRMTDPQ